MRFLEAAKPMNVSKSSKNWFKYYELDWCKQVQFPVFKPNFGTLRHEKKAEKGNLHDPDTWKAS